VSLQPATDSFRSDVSVRQEVIPDAGIGCGVGLLEGCVHFHVHSLWVGGPSGGPGAGAQSFERCLRLAGVTTGGLGSSPEPKAGVFVGLGVRYQLRQAGSGVVRWVWRAVAVMAAAKTRGSMPRATAAAVHASAYSRSPSPATRRRPRRPPERGARAQPSARTGDHLLHATHWVRSWHLPWAARRVVGDERACQPFTGIKMRGVSSTSPAR